MLPCATSQALYPGSCTQKNEEPMPARKPPRLWSSADLDAAIARVTPDVLALLGDGVPRAEAAIVTALADRHPKDDVRRTLMRLAVTEQLVETGGRYSLPAAEAGQG
jgi:hypothetical protein